MGLLREGQCLTALFHTLCRALCGGLLFTSVMASAYAAQLPFNQFLVFGDSVSDTGNISSGGPPYYAASAFTDGPDTTPTTQIQGVWHQQLAQDLGITLATASKTGGSNFAYYAAVSNGTKQQFPQITITSVDAYSLDAIMAGPEAQDVDQTYADFGGLDAPEPESLALLGGGIVLLGLLRLRKAR